MQYNFAVAIVKLLNINVEYKNLIIHIKMNDVLNNIRIFLFRIITINNNYY